VCLLSSRPYGSDMYPSPTMPPLSSSRPRTRLCPSSSALRARSWVCVLLPRPRALTPLDLKKFSTAQEGQAQGGEEQ
jgi:hypothetical protein